MKLLRKQGNREEKTLGLKGLGGVLHPQTCLAGRTSESGVCWNK